jgi:WD40 repeat protein
MIPNKAFPMGKLLVSRILIVLCLTQLGSGLGTSCWADEPPPFFRHLDTAAVSSDGSELATGSVDIKLINIKTGRTEHTLKGCGCSIAQILFSKDDRWLVSWANVCSGNTSYWEAKVWDRKTGKLRHTLPAHQISPKQPGQAAIGFTASGLLAATTDSDSCIRFWNIHSGKMVGTALRDSYYLSDDGSAVPRTKAVDSILKTFHWDTSPLLFTTFLPSGHLLLTINSLSNTEGSATVALLWDAATGKQVRSFPLKGKTAYSASIYGDRVLLVGKDFGSVWNLNGEAICDVWHPPPSANLADQFGNTHLIWGRLIRHSQEAAVISVRMTPYNHPPYWYKKYTRFKAYDSSTGAEIATLALVQD